MKSLRAFSLLSLFALALAVGGLSACNTVEGAGKDIAATGDAIKDKAREAK
jgi:predicted small secreted protein